MSCEELPAKRIKIETEDIVSDSDEFEEIISRDNECAENKDQKLVLLVDWSTRDKLVSNLTHFTSLLYTSTDCKKDQTKASQELIGKLMSLAIKGDRSRSKHESSRLTLELDHKLRNDVIANLISNNDSQQYGQQFKDKIKWNLIEENDRMLKALLSLPVYFGEGGSDKTVDSGELIESDEEIDSDQPQCVQIDKKLTALRKELKKEIQNLSKSTKTALNNRAETIFTFKVSSLKSFFRTGSDQFRFSESFFVRGMPWYIQLVFQEGGGTGQLGAYLHCDFKEPKSSRFSVETRFEFRLVSSLNYVKDVVNKFTHSYEKRVGHGTDRLIDYPTLIDSRNGFVEKDAFYLICHLFADKPVFFRKEENEDSDDLSF